MEIIDKDGIRYAIVLKSEDQDLDKPSFITDSKLPLQIGILAHPGGYVEKPHYHKTKERVIKGVPQMLYVKKGEIIIEFFDKENVKFNSVEMFRGDLILLLDGSHRLVVKKDLNAVMAKLGPYDGEKEDKVEIIEKQ